VIDDGEAVHYSAVPRGTTVYGSDGVAVGEVEQMLDNYREHIFDGVVFKDTKGDLRFADAPEVSRTAERGVTLAVDSAGALQLPPPDEGAPSFQPNRAGRIGRLLGGGWKRQ
jgi:hypothetical protein